MTKKKAVKRSVHVDSHNTRVELRAGSKETGELLWEFTYWPDNEHEVEGMNNSLATFLEKHDYEVVDGEA